MTLPVLKSIDQLGEQMDSAVDSQHGGINGKIIGVCPAPFSGCVVVVIALALTVDLGHEIGDTLAALLLFIIFRITSDAVDPKFLGGMNEDADDVVSVDQRFVSTAADKDTGTLVSQGFDRFELGQEYLLAQGHISKCGSCVIAE